MSRVSGFMTALGFLSRLGPSRHVSPTDFSRSLPFFPMVGLVLGLATVLPFSLGLFRSSPWIQAWLMAVLNFYLTRGLHWDGWADLADGLGSRSEGERFWKIIKDSSTGVFGASGLFLGLTGQIILFQKLALVGEWSVIIWAMVLARGSSVLLARLGKNLSREGLGSLFLQGVTTNTAASAIAIVITLGLFLVPVQVLALSLGLCLLGTAHLFSLARKSGGINGDFLGAAIVLSELLTLLCAFVMLS